MFCLIYFYEVLVFQCFIKLKINRQNKQISATIHHPPTQHLSSVSIVTKPSQLLLLSEIIWFNLSIHSATRYCSRLSKIKNLILFMWILPIGLSYPDKVSTNIDSLQWLKCVDLKLFSIKWICASIIRYASRSFVVRFISIFHVWLTVYDRYGMSSKLILFQ